MQEVFNQSQAGLRITRLYEDEGGTVNEETFNGLTVHSARVHFGSLFWGIEFGRYRWC